MGLAQKIRQIRIDTKRQLAISRSNVSKVECWRDFFLRFIRHQFILSSYLEEKIQIVTTFFGANISK